MSAAPFTRGRCRPRTARRLRDRATPAIPPLPSGPSTVGRGRGPRALPRAPVLDADQPLSLYVHLPFCQPAVPVLRLHGGDLGTAGPRRPVSRCRRAGDRTRRPPTWASAGAWPRCTGAAAPRPSCRWSSSAACYGTHHRRLPASCADAPRSPSRWIPHVTTPEQVDTLFDLGINRVSMGVQDLDPHRAEDGAAGPDRPTRPCRLIEHCRARGVEGINVDLMYGLPSADAPRASANDGGRRSSSGAPTVSPSSAMPTCPG